MRHIPGIKCIKFTRLAGFFFISGNQCFPMSSVYPPGSLHEYPVCSSRGYHMSTDHRRFHIAVSQQFLHRADVETGFQQMRGKTVPECMASDMLGDFRKLDRFFRRSLQCAFMYVVSSTSSCTGSVQIFFAGNTYCHPHSSFAFGYLRSSAYGNSTSPAPRAVKT